MGDFGLDDLDDILGDLDDTLRGLEDEFSNLTSGANGAKPVVPPSDEELQKHGLGNRQSVVIDLQSVKLGVRCCVVSRNIHFKKKINQDLGEDEVKRLASLATAHPTPRPTSAVPGMFWFLNVLSVLSNSVYKK